MATTSFLLQFQERAAGPTVRGNVKTKTDAREDDDVARDLRAHLKTFTKSREEPDQDVSLRLVPEGVKTATRETRPLRSRVKTFTESREEPDQDVSLRLVPDVGTKTATRESADAMSALDLLTRTETRTREESDQDVTSPSYFTFPRA